MALRAQIFSIVQREQSQGLTHKCTSEHATRPYVKLALDIYTVGSFARIKFRQMVGSLNMLTVVEKASCRAERSFSRSSRLPLSQYSTSSIDGVPAVTTP